MHTRVELPTLHHTSESVNIFVPQGQRFVVVTLAKLLRGNQPDVWEYLLITESALAMNGLGGVYRIPGGEGADERRVASSVEAEDAPPREEERIVDMDDVDD